jgi:hypothetical protein
MVLAGETEVLGEYLPQRHYVHHKSHLPDPGTNSGRRGAKPATDLFSYGVALRVIYHRRYFMQSVRQNTLQLQIKNNATNVM